MKNPCHFAIGCMCSKEMRLDGHRATHSGKTISKFPQSYCFLITESWVLSAFLRYVHLSVYHCLAICLSTYLTVHYIFWIWVLYHIYGLQCFLPVSGLLFYSLYSVIQKQKFFIWMKFTSSIFLSLCIILFMLYLKTQSMS